jgi:L-malate glycosyltransferase
MAKNEPMKICYIADGMSNHTQRLANYFAKAGHYVHVISWREKPGYNENIKIHILSKKSGFSLLTFLKWRSEIRGLLKTIKPDVIDSHYITTNGFLAACTGFHPFVVTVLGSDLFVDPWKNPIYKLLAQYTLKHSDRISCLFSLDLARDKLTALGIDLSKVAAYYLGVDTSEFKYTPDSSDVRKQLGLDSSSPIVLNLRGLDPIYDVDTLLKAIPYVLKQVPEARFIIAYKKNESSKVKQIREALDKPENVIFLEWIPRSQLPNILSTASVYVSSSLSDGASNALFEAMSCQLAPVVTAIPANRHWVKDGINGFLFNPGDFHTLSEKIITLLKDKCMRASYGEKCRDLVRKEVEYAVQMAGIEQQYRSLTKMFNK